LSQSVAITIRLVKEIEPDRVYPAMEGNGQMHRPRILLHFQEGLQFAAPCRMAQLS